MLKLEDPSTDNATRPEGKLSVKSGLRSPPSDAVAMSWSIPKSCNAALTSSCACRRQADGGVTGH